MTWISTPRGLYGESGIRTHGTLTSTHAFQACTFGHSVISPRHRMCRGRRRHGWRRRRPRPRTGRGRRVHGCTSDDQDTGCTSSQTTSRREWDSNPRSRKRLNGFRDRPIRPLSHLSKTQDGSRSAKYMDVPEPTAPAAQAADPAPTTQGRLRLTREATSLFVPKRIRTSDL